MKSFFYYVFFVTLLILIIPSVSHAAQNTTGYAWGENVGWVNVATSTATWGVEVTDTALTGYMYGENIGWISLNCSNTNSCAVNPYFVANNSQGKLSGYAWGENVGWIDFSRVTIGTTTNVGEFLGYAYGENIGWISFNCANGSNTCATNPYKATTSWRMSGSATHSISGNVSYYTGLKGISGATVTLENNLGVQINTTTTDSSGAYQFTGVPDGGNYVVRVTKSDLTTSGLSSADQIKIGRHVVGAEPFSQIYKRVAGDVNNSGSLSSADQIKIGRRLVGADSVLISGAWRFYPSGTVVNPANYLSVATTTTYTNLTANMISQDFVGIKMGDTNASW